MHSTDGTCYLYGQHTCRTHGHRHTERALEVLVLQPASAGLLNGDVACSADDMRRYGIQTILDLRRMDRPCKKKGKRIDKLRTAVRFARKVLPIRQP